MFIPETPENKQSPGDTPQELCAKVAETEPDTGRRLAPQEACSMAWADISGQSQLSRALGVGVNIMLPFRAARMSPGGREQSFASLPDCKDRGEAVQ